MSTVLGPLLLPWYINDTVNAIGSELRIFADNFVCYREIRASEDSEDTVNLRAGSWTRNCDMRFQPVKRNIMKVTRKQNE